MNIREKILTNGYTIIHNVLDKDEIKHALSLLPINQYSDDIGGFNFSLTHSTFSNYLRNHPNIKKVFADIWNTTDLISSLDCPIIWKTIPLIENIHVDQNPHYKKGFYCVQGMIHLTDTTLGGLQIVPNTNTDDVQKHLCKTYPHIKQTKEDWLELYSDDPFYSNAIQIPCKAGTMILWDSRTLHGAYINNSKDLVARISFPICMLPANKLSEKFLLNREKIIKENKTLNHWANEITNH